MLLSKEKRLLYFQLKEVLVVQWLSSYEMDMTTKSIPNFLLLLFKIFVISSSSYKLAKVFKSEFKKKNCLISFVYFNVHMSV